MLRMATPEDDKRLEEELLRLNDQDMLVFKLFKKASTTKEKRHGELTPLYPTEIFSNNGHSLTQEQINSSLYKLYRNGKLKSTSYNGQWAYMTWT